MSRSELGKFSYEVLALVGRTGAGAHDLLQMARKAPLYAWAGESQYYTEPKRLARLGYLDAEKRPGKTRERTFYTLNRRGLDALRTWAEEPVHFPRLRHEALVRVLAADLVGENRVRHSLQSLRGEIALYTAEIERAEGDAEAIPHRRTALLLNHKLARKLLAAHLEWLDEVERELVEESV